MARRKLLSRSLLTILVVMVLAPPLTTAQPTNEPLERIRLTSEAVVLDVVVRDKKGRMITDLTRDEFHVFENGEERDVLSVRFIDRHRPAGISELEQEQLPSHKYLTSPPVSILNQRHLVSLVFDRLDNETRRYSREAIDDLLEMDLPDDTYFGVFVIDQRLLALTHYTTDLEQIRTAVGLATSGSFERIRSQSNQLHAELMESTQQLSGLLDAPAPEMTGIGGAGGAADMAAQMARRGQAITELILLVNILEAAFATEGTVQGHDVLDAMQALVSAQKALPGRKSVVFFSQGLFIPDDIVYRFRNLISQSNLSNVSIYAVDARGVTSQSQNQMSAETLRRAAELTRAQVQSIGGPVSVAQVRSMETAMDSIRMNVQETLEDLSRSTGGFLTANTNDPGEAMDRLVGELHRYYEVAYLPAAADLDPGYRKITVEVDRPSVAVQSRDGFFPMPPAGDEPPGGYELMLLEILTRSPRPREFPLRTRAFHFEPMDRGIEQIVVATVPCSSLEFREDDEKGLYSARVSILVLVKSFDGEVLFKRSRNYSLEGPLKDLEDLKSGNVLFIEGVTLTSGRYYVESAAHDHFSGTSSARKQVYVVTKPGTETHISSLVMVAGLEPLSKVERFLHSPLKHSGYKVIPRVLETVGTSEKAEAVFYCVVYPPGPNAVAPQLTVAVSRDGEILFRGSPALSTSGEGRFASLFTIPTEGLPSGTYELLAFAQSGGSRARESILFTVTGKGN